MPDPVKRPWWKRNGWRIVIACWLTLPVLYPLSTGPALYCWHRGWIGTRSGLGEPYASFYAPLGPVVRLLPGSWQVRWNRCGQQWVHLADRHENPQDYAPQMDWREYRALCPDPKLVIPPDADEKINRTHWRPPAD